MTRWQTTGLRLALITGFLGALTAIQGCKTLGVPAPADWNERLSAVYTAVSAARDGTLTLLQARTITPQEAQGAQDKANQVRGALDLADGIHRTDPGKGESLLVRARSAIVATQGCIDAKVDFSNCIEHVEVPTQ